jgi:hypothetical protein
VRLAGRLRTCYAEALITHRHRPAWFARYSYVRLRRFIIVKPYLDMWASRRRGPAGARGSIIATAVIVFLVASALVGASHTRRSLNYIDELRARRALRQLTEPAATSSLCCSELPSFLNLDSGFPDVCGGSPGCNSNSDYEGARSHCEAAGARLCTHDELSAEETKGTGCVFDFHPVWSATPCTVPDSGEASFIAAEGRTGVNSFCPTPDTRLRVRCCADAECDARAPVPATLPPNAALGKPTFQSSVGWGGDSSNAVDGNPTGVRIPPHPHNILL